MKKLILIAIMICIPVIAGAQSKLAIMKSVTYSKSHTYFCPGIGIKHENLTTAQPQYWYGGQLVMEINESVEVLGRLKWNMGNGTAHSAKPDGELGIWYKIGL